ncbi:MAG: 50S ribosomal protein L29 [Bdellovibrionales bacterium]|nr:50S ribosomal protein L29 [Bdellovibrionales bacterium]
MKKTEFLGEVREMSVADLRQRARQLAQELMKLRFRKASGQLENTHGMRLARRNLARVKTEITLREKTA